MNVRRLVAVLVLFVSVVVLALGLLLLQDGIPGRAVTELTAAAIVCGQVRQGRVVHVARPSSSSLLNLQRSEVVEKVCKKSLY